VALRALGELTLAAIGVSIEEGHYEKKQRDGTEGHKNAESSSIHISSPNPLLLLHRYLDRPPLLVGKCPLRYAFP
jgi:hypothetical protein